MPYTQPEGPGRLGQKLPLNIKSGAASFQTGRFGAGLNGYWGRYSIGAFPISFDKNVDVSEYHMYITSVDESFDGGAMRVWIYEADTAGMPRTLAWDPGIVPDLGLTGPGSYGKSATAALLYANRTYWVASQLVLQDEEGDVLINAEDNTGTTNYRSPLGLGLDPAHSIGYGSVNDVAFNEGKPVVGLYIDELQSGGWTPGTPAAATLTGSLGSGFYPSSTQTTIWLKVQED